jgi:hypothetical protein
VLFDRICRENGIRHLLTAPRSPTTTGKVERFHRTLRREFLNGKVFDSIEQAQAALDAWVEHYNNDRPHQGIGMVAPWERFRLAAAEPVEAEPVDVEALVEEAPSAPTTTRKVDSAGNISFAAAKYRVGRWLAGQEVTVVCDGGLVQLHHRGVLMATHARRHSPDKQKAGLERVVRHVPPRPSQRPSATAVSVTRKVDSSGNVSFAGTGYAVGSGYRRRQVQVAVVGDRVEISIGKELIRSHPVRHDATREHGALANPGGRPRRINAA